MATADGAESMYSSDPDPCVSNGSLALLNPAKPQHTDEWLACVRTGNIVGIQSILLSSQVNTGTFATIVQDSDESGRTALHWAAREGQLAVARYLIQDAGANVLAEDFDGMRPSHHARELYYMDLARFLEAYETSFWDAVVCIQVRRCPSLCR
jgi:ankyrin repeat protein